MAGDERLKASLELLKRTVHASCFSAVDSIEPRAISAAKWMRYFVAPQARSIFQGHEKCFPTSTFLQRVTPFRFKGRMIIPFVSQALPNSSLHGWRDVRVGPGKSFEQVTALIE